jgi:acyl-CoA thioesterase I
MPMPSSELERLVRYCHPKKLLATTRLPGRDALDDEVLARLYGVAVESYREQAGALHEQARRSAHELAELPEVRRAILALPLRLGDRVLAVGDSHTDDLASWAEILRHLLCLLRADEAIGVINAGVSGDTTTNVLARVTTLPPAGFAVLMVGTNDARRHGRDGAPMLVSHAESQRNLRAIHVEVQRRARSVAWITPPPVDERRITEAAPLAEAGLTWRLPDVEHKAALVRGLDADVLDLWPAFGLEHLADDGLHASAAGQRLILRELLRAIPKRSSSHRTANEVRSRARKR